MNNQDFKKKLPMRVRIYAPLINGEDWLRGLGIPGDGPYTGGASFYMIANRDWVIKEHARRRGTRRRDLEEIVSPI